MAKGLEESCGEMGMFRVLMVVVTWMWTFVQMYT